MPVLASNQLAGASVAGRLRQHVAPRGLIELAKEAAEYANSNCRSPLLKAKAEATPGSNFLLTTDLIGALLKAMSRRWGVLGGGPETAARSGRSRWHSCQGPKRGLQRALLLPLWQPWLLLLFWVCAVFPKEHRLPAPTFISGLWLFGKAGSGREERLDRLLPEASLRPLRLF